MPTQQIEAKTLREMAYQAIKDSILNNELLPGQEVLITSVAASLGISQTPVREAVTRLAADGLMEYTPHRTLRVAGLDEDDVREVYEVRRLLEPYAAECAARRLARDPHLRERLLEVLRRAEHIAKVGPVISLEEYVGIDLHLNEIFLGAVENRLFREMFTLLANRSLRIRTFAEATADTVNRRLIGTVTGEHIGIVRAILAEDAERARRLVAEHLANGEARTIAAVRERLRG